MGHKIYDLLRLPFKKGRLLWTPDTGSSLRPADMFFMSHLQADHYDGDKKLIQQYDLGSGKVTNVGVNMLANDPTWVAAATPFATLSIMNFVSTGTGATADAAGDYWLQTVGTHFSGGTNGYFTGAISLTAPNIWKNVATVNYSGSEAVTEWVLTMSNAANFARTSAGAAPTQTTFTDTGAAFTTTGNALKGWTILINATAANTPTTLAQALVVSNTATVLTTSPGPDSTHWWSLADASVVTPGATIAYVVYPTAWDHKNFAAINVNAGDSIAFSYSLTINSNG